MKFYNQIDTALKSYEDFKPYHQKSVEWITNRIDWCWKFRKITHDQMVELVDRVIAVMNNGFI